MQQSVNLDDLYAVLRAWAMAKPGQIKTYTELSDAYHARTGVWHEPHGSWDVPLGAVNSRLHIAAGAPALSAIIVLKATNEPGGAFWGCAPNVPTRPTSDIQRLAVWQGIVQKVHAYAWTATLP